MDWNQAMEDNRRVLKSIVATLFALAILAESLCDRSAPVRGFVLWILRRAETVVWDLVCHMANDHGMMLPRAFFLVLLLNGSSPADAMRLARSFRTLARRLDRLADRSGKPRRCDAARANVLLMPILGRFADRLAVIATLMANVPPNLTVERLDSS